MGRPSVDSEQVNLRIVRADLDGIDAFSASQPDQPKRPEAIRRIIRDWLHSKGFINEPVGIIPPIRRPSGIADDQPQEGTRPEDLNASNDD